MSGPLSGSHDIVAGGGVKALMEPAGQGQPDVTFRCDTQTFVLLVYGRLSLEQAVADGLIIVSGDNALAVEFGR